MSRTNTRRNESEISETNPILPGDNLIVAIGNGFVNFRGSKRNEWIHAETESVVVNIEDNC